MGFRSTFITEDLPIDWPVWFVDKWQEWVHFLHGDNGVATGCISSKCEAKTYGKWEELPQDIQKVWSEINHQALGAFRLLFFHECGGCSVFDISKDKIVITEPEAWSKVDEISHFYCVGCHEEKWYG